eukprot:355315-Chlamydomonas_euryale.AAC.2
MLPGGSAPHTRIAAAGRIWATWMTRRTRAASYNPATFPMRPHQCDMWNYPWPHSWTLARPAILSGLEHLRGWFREERGYV